ncbi:AfsR/SARP family transcriptional regulator [Streptomyces endocoffeicus]|uniref:AfsR/SARP family transcriptional regulator n=1 Tax=Streptomyces endocoffeicus TaxID=2898945 RepID=UPI0027DE7DEF|nr:BTAD domain-containing putative transcriptional regulator [Streptomyces endocoffeicus]
MSLGSPQQQALFVALLLRQGRTAGAEVLIDALWGTDAPASAMRTLRTYAWRLRKVLEDDSKFPSTLVSVGDGYRLAWDTCYVDLDDAVSLARQAQQSDDLEGAYGFLEAALGLWHGEPLTAIPGPFAARERDRLNEVHLYIQEEHIAAGLALGYGPRYIAELIGLIDRYSLRERLYVLLIQAQSQAGRRGDALATYRRARRTLIDELGVEPGQELKALHDRVLAGTESELHARPTGRPEEAVVTSAAVPVVVEETAPPPRARETDIDREDMPYLAPAQLPPDLADFTGRNHLTLAISSLMNTPDRSALPVGVLVGMAGVGKSALALHVAHTIRDSYPEGQMYAKLRAGDGGPVPPDEVLAGFLVSLGLRLDDLPETLEARTALLRTLLARRRVLLVLDDAVTAEQVRPLLPGSAGCGVLVTTRTRLAGLPALQAEVPAFAPSEALDFLRRAIGSERVDTELAAAQQIVESCAMLPLALRIIAARLAARPSWSLQSISTRLADEFQRIQELRSGDVTISAVFDLTYRHLPEDQASALRKAAVVDSRSLSLSCAAAQLAMTDEQAETLLDALVDQAMLESPSPGLYRFHSLLRDFARRKARPHEQMAALEGVLNHLLASAKSAFRQVVPGDPVEDALSSTRAPGARVTSPEEARQWAERDGECALKLVQQLARDVAGATPEHGQDGAHTRLQRCVDLLIALSAFRGSLHHGDYQRAVDRLESAVATSRDVKVLGRVRFLRGHMELSVNQFARAEWQASAAVRLCTTSHDLVILRQALNDLGLACQMQGKFQEAIECYDKAIDLARRLGHTSGETATTVNMALSKVHVNEPLEAERICRKVLDEVASPDDVEGVAYAYYVLGLAHHRQAQHDTALHWFEMCLALCTANGLRARESHARLRIAELSREMGLLDRAVREGGLSVKLCEETTDLKNLAQALTVVGNALRELGEDAAAQEYLARAGEVMDSMAVPREQVPPAQLASRSRTALTGP